MDCDYPCGPIKILTTLFAIKHSLLNSHCSKMCPNVRRWRSLSALHNTIIQTRMCSITYLVSVKIQVHHIALFCNNLLQIALNRNELQLKNNTVCPYDFGGSIWTEFMNILSQKTNWYFMTFFLSTNKVWWIFINVMEKYNKVKSLFTDFLRQIKSSNEM